MSNEGFDLCECVWSQEYAMRRLLNFLRESQGYCTDNECPTELPGPSSRQDAMADNTVLFTMVWVILAMALFFLRPSSLRSNPDSKRSNNDQDRGLPPSPPTSN